MKKTIQKALGLMLSVIMVFSLVTTTAFAGDGAVNMSMTADKSSYKAGDTVSVTVNLNENPGIGAINIMLKYDSDALEITNITKGAVLKAVDDDENDLWTMVILNKEGGTILASALADVTETGKFVTVKFLVKDSAPAGDKTVTAEITDGLAANLCNAAGDSLGFACTAANFAIEGAACAHANKAAHPANDATCIAAGNSAYWSCPDCGKFFSDEACTAEITEGSWVKEALGHNFKGDMMDNGDGTHSYKCTRCDVYGDPAAHTYGQWTDCNDGANHQKECGCGNIVKEAHTGGTATCTKKAVCSECGAEYGDLAAHDFAGQPWKNDASGHWHECKNCSAKDEVVAHTSDYSEATEEHGINCTICGYEIAPKLNHTHVYDKEVANDTYLASAATCVDKATYYKSCACGAKGTETFQYGDVDATNHVGGTDVRDAKEATCTEDGYTGDTYCGSCGNKISDGEVIKAAGHDYEGQPWMKDETGHWHECKNCPAKSDVVAHTPDYPEATEEHGVKCTVCGYEIAPALNHVHAYTQRVATDAFKASDATCVDKATYYYSCTCGDKGADTFESGDVDANNHVGDTDVRNFVEADCTDDGYTGDTYCMSCNKVLVEGEVTKALGHNYGEWSVKTPATCTEDGVKAHYCTRCQNEETDKIPATGHAWGEWKTVEEPTYDADGSAIRVCANDDSHVEDKSIPKLVKDDPTQPTDPTNPTQPTDDPTKPVDNNKPETGDAGVGIWVAVLTVSALFGTAIVVKKRHA